MRRLTFSATCWTILVLVLAVVPGSAAGSGASAPGRQLFVGYGDACEIP